MSYEVTVRNRHNTKIVQRWEVDDDSKSLRDIIDEAQRNRRVDANVREFKRKHPASPIKYYWYPELAPVPSPPPPPPEPIGFDILVDQWSV